MASFLAGPAAELVGLGMQAVGVGIPVSSTATKLINGARDLGVPLPPKSWFKNKRGEGLREEQRQTVYDKLESHVNGVIQVMKPVIELKQMVREGCCRSVDRDPRSRGRERSPRSELRYYTPQKCTSGSSCIYPPSTPEPRESSQKRNNNYIERWSVRRNNSYSGDESSCLHCSQSKSLIQLPCGRLICPNCDKTANHHLTCKQCKKLAD